MDQREIDITLNRIRSALEKQRLEDGVQILMELHPADQAEVFNAMESDEREGLIPYLDVPATAALFEELEDQDVLDVVGGMQPDRLADVLDEMDPDEAADLLGDLPPEQASQALSQMEDASEVLPLLGYPDETAGGLMTTAYVALRRQTTAAKAIDFFRAISPETEIPYDIFVVDRERHLIGVVGLRELVISSPETTVEMIMDRDVIYVTVGVDQEEVARIMMRYDLSAIPVVDGNERLVGVVTLDDIVDVIEEETTEDILHLSAVETGPVSDKSYWSQRIRDVARSRFVWLLVLFVAATFTGGIMRFYERELETVVALSFFVPLLMGTGGNSGSQTVATVIRALALREIRPRDALKVWLREAQTASILGIMLGLVAFSWGMLWGGDFYLAVTVSISVAAVVVWANSVAALVPLVASNFGIDPTMVSGPMMSTLIDGTGLVIYFSLASLIIPQL